MQAISRDLLGLIVSYPSPFGVVPQLNFRFLPDFHLKDLSVALLITFLSFVQFSRCSLPVLP